MRDVRTLVDHEIQQERDEDLLALKDQQAPADAVSYDELFESWMRLAKRQNESVTDKRVMRERLQYSLATEWPTRLASEIDHENILLSRVGVADRVAGQYIATGSKDVTLVIHPRGAEAARHTPLVQGLIESGRSVLMIDAFQTGASRTYRNRSNRYFLTYNRSDDANRVQDILTALAFLKSNYSGRIRLVGLENAGVWCTFAAAVAPINLTLTASLEGFSGTDEDFKKGFFVPGSNAPAGCMRPDCSPVDEDRTASTFYFLD